MRSNKILKDIVTKSRQMMVSIRITCRAGTATAFRSNGDRGAVRAKGKNKDAVPINSFRKECRDFAAHWMKVQRDESSVWGVIGDWTAAMRRWISRRRR